MPGDSGSEQARDNKIIPSATFHYRTQDTLCCVEAECHFHYLGDSGLYMYTKAAAWATVATVATPLPMWGVKGSGMVP
jgi:hypothetical protein